jgi:putative hydrolase of the HAD superfamily
MRRLHQTPIEIALCPTSCVAQLPATQEVRYVFFDVDDTLVEWRVSWQGAFVHVAAEAGVAITWDEAAAKLREALDSYYPDCVAQHCAAGPPDLREFWLDYDGRILAAMGVRGDLRHYAGRIFDLLQHPEAIRLYPEVLEVLDALTARGARLGIISGRPLARPDLERLGIAHYFDPILDAFGAGSTKSDPRIFHLAAAAAAGRPAWHVGDSYPGDIVGARAAGLRPVLLDRTASHNGADCPRISDLRELLDLVG